MQATSMFHYANMADVKKSKRVQWTIAAIAAIAAVLLVVVIVPVALRFGETYETPIGCGSMGAYVTLGNSSQDKQFSLEDCWDHFHNVPGPNLLLVDDLSQYGRRWSHGHSWAGPDDIGSENNGGANFENDTLAYNYTYVVGDGKGNGPRTVSITFLNGQSFFVAPDTDTAFMISTQNGLWVQTTVIDLPHKLDFYGKVSAIQALVDENEVIRNFLTNNSSLDVEEPMDESYV
jgi:hypothetical protein